MRFLRTLLTAAAFIWAASASGQAFSKFFVFGPNSPFATTSFISSHELNDTSGFLILASRYTTYYNGYVIRTDTNLNEVWTTSLNFQNAPFPYDGISFLDVGELMNGNIYVYGTAGPGGTIPHYVLFILNPAGQVIDYIALHDSLASPQGANINMPRLGPDSSIVIPISMYDLVGSYRLDQDLSFLGYQSYMVASPAVSRGRDCIMLRDTNLLVHSTAALTKTDTSGNILWSKGYSDVNQFFSLLEMPGGSIYASCHATGPTVNAAVAKFDAAGNPVFLKTYCMAPLTNTSPAWEIYPVGNDLMVYSDSVMFRIDTNGTVIGWGKTVDAYNSKIMRPAQDNMFTLTGLIMQDSMGWYQYSLMKFNDSTVSGCLHPRGMITNSLVMQVSNMVTVLQPSGVVQDSINFTWNAVNLQFDALNGCPPGPLSVDEPVSPTETLLVFPNPASDMVQLQCGESQCALVAYDVMGREVYTAITASNGRAVIDVSAWADGVYSVVATEGEVRSVQRLVVKH